MEPDQSYSQTIPLSAKQSLIKRYKFIWRVLLISNLALGSYMFAKARKNDKKAAKSRKENRKAPEVVPAATIPLFEELEVSTMVKAPVKVREPIPENQQKELFQWILEEKRKIKPRDPQEKKQIDEDKAILKQFVRAKSLPPF